MGPLECSECPHECSGPFGIIVVEIYGVANIEWLEGSARVTELLHVFLMVAYFFMVRETATVDMMSCVSEIVEVRSDVLVDFLVMLARVVDAVAPCSP